MFFRIIAPQLQDSLPNAVTVVPPGDGTSNAGDLASVARMTRCAVGVLWRPSEDEAEAAEGLLAERSTKVFVVVVCTLCFPDFSIIKKSVLDFWSILQSQDYTAKAQVRSLVIGKSRDGGYRVTLLCPKCRQSVEATRSATWRANESLDFDTSCGPILEGCHSPGDTFASIV